MPNSFCDSPRVPVTCPTPVGSTIWASLFPALLVIVAVLFLAWHFLAWQKVGAKPDLDGAEWNFRRRQFLRRLQVSGMLLILGVLLFVGQFLFSGTEHPGWAIAYWLAVAVITFWMILAAVADMLAGISYFGRLKTQADIERIRLSAIINRFYRIHGNGEEKPKESSAKPEKPPS